MEMLFGIVNKSDSRHMGLDRRKRLKRKLVRLNKLV